MSIIRFRKISLVKHVCLLLLVSVIFSSTLTTFAESAYNISTRKLYNGDSSNQITSTGQKTTQQSINSNTVGSASIVTTSSTSITTKKVKVNWQLSGTEVKYEPFKWNNNSQTISSTNCYAYAFDLMFNPSTKKTFYNHAQVQAQRYRKRDLHAQFGLQPGALSGQTLSDDLSNIADLMKNDAKIANIKFYSISKTSKPPKGTYKIALFTSTYKGADGKTMGYDYHLYRQNPDGTWSHKPGATRVTNVDSSGKKIYDPEKADRTIPLTGGMSYNHLVGYFAVGK